MLSWKGLKLDGISHALSSLGNNLAIVISKAECSVFFCQGRMSLSARRIYTQATGQGNPKDFTDFSHDLFFLLSNISSLKTEKATDRWVDSRGGGGMGRRQCPSCTSEVVWQQGWGPL